MNYSEIAKKLIGNGFECYMVGGSVRDRLLGIAPKDIDLATNAHPQQIMSLFSSENTKDIGKSFPVITVDGIEIATYRLDNSVGIGSKKTETTYSDNIFDDLKRRDLSINAMAINMGNNDFIDLHNGKKDLENRIIRLVGNPLDRISDDPDRILRSCRFLAKINGSFDINTFCALRDNVRLISFITPERIRIEIIKALEIPKASTFFYTLYHIGALQYIFPSLASCYGHEHGEHHKENIWVHNLICGDSISTKYPMVKLAGYLHDVGKPPAYLENNKENFGKHEILSRDLVEKEMKSLIFSNDEIEEVSGLIRCHMYNLTEATPKAIRRLLKKFNDKKVDIDSFIRLRIADRKANLAKEPYGIDYIRNAIKVLKDPSNKELPFNTHSLALSGGEIKDIFGIEGKEIGQIQKYLLQEVLIHGSNINNKSDLIDLAEEMLLTGYGDDYDDY